MLDAITSLDKVLYSDGSRTIHENKITANNTIINADDNLIILFIRNLLKFIEIY